MIFKHFFDAAYAHMQSWERLHFEKTKYGKAISQLRDQYLGQKCVIVGNGPSLSAKDLQVLWDQKVFCFGTNRIYNIFPQTDWRPNVYMTEDILVLKDVLDELEKIPAQYKFIPIHLKWDNAIRIPDFQYYYLDYHSEHNDSCGFSLNAAHDIRCRGSITLSCIQMAIYMGFSDIYLIGVDHNFTRMIDKSGKLIEDQTLVNHFSTEYDKNMVLQDVHIDDLTEAYLNVEKLSQQTKVFRVYNATRGGKLEAFQRVDFDSIF